MGFPRQEYWSGLLSFSTWSSRPKDGTWVSCIDRWFFTTEPPREPWRLLGVAKSDSFTKDGALRPQFSFDVGFAWTFTRQTHFWKCLAVLFLIIWGYSTFSPFTFPHSFSPHLSHLFENSYSDRCEMIAQCSFDLHFSENKWCWTSFHVGYLYVFSGKMSIQILSSFFNQTVICLVSGFFVFSYWVAWTFYIF